MIFLSKKESAKFFSKEVCLYYLIVFKGGNFAPRSWCFKFYIPCLEKKWEGPLCHPHPMALIMEYSRITFIIIIIIIMVTPFQFVGKGEGSDISVYYNHHHHHHGDSVSIRRERRRTRTWQNWQPSSILQGTNWRR